MITKEELEVRFNYHSPSPEQVIKYGEIRRKCHELADLIVNLTPASREQSEAITNLETAQFYANAAIARRS